MRRRPEREVWGFASPAGALIAASAVAVVVALNVTLGAGMFSAGPLNAQSTGRNVGGVASHAATGADCPACHTAPWEGATMSDRCVACHRDVALQLSAGKGLHARMAGTAASPECRGCHTDHRGPSASLTFFDHTTVGFPLTGGHSKVSCDQCHRNARTTKDFTRAPRDCFGCHAKADPHKGAFGRRCDRCHDTTTWSDARFDHSVFPTDHGSEERRPTCKTCHPADVSAYTCYGCHEHTPANVVARHEGRTLADLKDCIRCHRGGRTEGGD